MKHMKFILHATFILLLILSAGACSSSVTDDTTLLGKVTEYRATGQQLLAKNAPAPDFQIQMPNGNIRFLSDLRDNVVLLNFWAVSCPYCIIEMPYLQTVYDQLSVQGVVILGINVGESEKTVTKFVTEKGFTFPIILDPDIYASILYGAQYLPITYFIDKAGNIHGAKIGAFRDATEIVTAIKELLQ